MSNIELIIFDFDGVIVDSEYLFIKADRIAFAHAGINMSEHDINHKFIGVDFNNIRNILINDYGAERTAIYEKQVLIETQRLIRDELTTIPYIIEFLESTQLAYYVASNGHSQKTQQKIEILGIEHLFNNIIIGIDNVAMPKPAPDMFKLAADNTHTAYNKCMVIEDGIYGIQAAKTLNMLPIGFTGASHIINNHQQNLINAGAIVTFDDMRELPNIIKGL